MIISYDLKLVLLSVAIAILGANAGFTFLANTEATARLPYKMRIAGGAIAIGGSIWAMHFMGMIALSLPINVDFAVLPTLISALVAIIFTGLGLYAGTSGHINRYGNLVGALLMGSGISVMHYSGMEAVRANCIVAYSSIACIASVVISMTMSFWALRFITPGILTMRKTSIAAVILGVAISSMHYVAMWGTRFTFSDDIIMVPVPILNETYIACVVAVLAFLLCNIFLLLVLPNAKKEESLTNQSVGGAVLNLMEDPMSFKTGTFSLMTPTRQNNGLSMISSSVKVVFGLRNQLRVKEAHRDQIAGFDDEIGRARVYPPDQEPIQSTGLEGSETEQDEHDSLPHDTTVTIQCNNETHFIDSDHIIYVAAEGHYTIIAYLDNDGGLQSHLCNKPISKLEKALSGHGFLRVHRSYLANLKYITGYQRKGESGELIFQGDDAPRIPISRSQYARVCTELKKWNRTV
jgi:NO-binding membrane sensor protein with MHYT domain